MVAMEAVKVIYCCSVLLLLATVNGHGTWASQLSIVSTPSSSSFCLVPRKLLFKKKEDRILID